MDPTSETVQTLVTYLTQTLSPEYDIRKPAEDCLMSLEKQPNYSILLLQLTDSEPVPMHIRLAAAINFKNFVKRNWRVVDDVNNVSGIESSSWLAIELLSNFHQYMHEYGLV